MRYRNKKPVQSTIEILDGLLWPLVSFYAVYPTKIYYNSNNIHN